MEHNSRRAPIDPTTLPSERFNPFHAEHTPPGTASAMTSGAVQSTSHGGEQSPVSPSAHAGTSTNESKRSVAPLPWDQSTAATQLNVGKPEQSGSLTGSAFSPTCNSLAGKQGDESRLSGYSDDVASQTPTALTSRAE